MPPKVAVALANSSLVKPKSSKVISALFEAAIKLFREVTPSSNTPKPKTPKIALHAWDAPVEKAINFSNSTTLVLIEELTFPIALENSSAAFTC